MMIAGSIAVRGEQLEGTCAAVLRLGRSTGNWRYGDPEVRKQIARHALDRDLQAVFVLHPDMSGRVVDFSRVSTRSEFHGDGATLLLAPLLPGASRFVRKHVWGLETDGVANVPHGAGVWISSADCPTVVLASSERVAVCHAGRQSMFDHEKPSRWSVVRNALCFFSKAERSRMTVWILCGIGGESYKFRLDDPMYGERNQRLLHEIARRFGVRAVVRTEDDAGWAGLSLRHMIEHELRQYEVSDIRFDGIDTRTAMESDGSFSYWSHRRGDHERNGILVYVPPR